MKTQLVEIQKLKYEINNLSNEINKLKAINKELKYNSIMMFITQ